MDYVIKFLGCNCIISNVNIVNLYIDIDFLFYDLNLSTQKFFDECPEMLV